MTLEGRRDLAEVVEEWILVPVARGLAVPARRAGSQEQDPAGERGLTASRLVQTHLNSYFFLLDSTNSTAVVNLGGAPSSKVINTV